MRFRGTAVKKPLMTKWQIVHLFSDLQIVQSMAARSVGSKPLG
jgi:hypothetical protein